MLNTLFQPGHLRLQRLWLLLGFVMVGAIFFFSLTTAVMPDGRHVDKLFHLASYAIVTGWFSQLYSRLAERLLIALGFALMGVAIEFLQGLHPMRYFDVADMLANTAGAMIALLLCQGQLGSLLLRFETLYLGPEADAE